MEYFCAFCVSKVFLTSKFLKILKNVWRETSMTKSWEMVLFSSNLFENICSSCLEFPLHLCLMCLTQYQENSCLNLACLFISIKMIASTLCQRGVIVLNLFSINKLHFLKDRKDKRQNTILNRFLFNFCHPWQSGYALLHS